MFSVIGIPSIIFVNVSGVGIKFKETVIGGFDVRPDIGLLPVGLFYFVTILGICVAVRMSVNKDHRNIAAPIGGCHAFSAKSNHLIARAIPLWIKIVQFVFAGFIVVRVESHGAIKPKLHVVTAFLLCFINANHKRRYSRIFRIELPGFFQS